MAAVTTHITADKDLDDVGTIDLAPLVYGTPAHMGLVDSTVHAAGSNAAAWATLPPLLLPAAACRQPCMRSWQPAFDSA